MDNFDPYNAGSSVTASMREQTGDELSRLEDNRRRRRLREEQENLVVRKSDRVYYEQASRSSPDVSHLPLQLNLDFDIDLRLLSHNSSVPSISGRTFFAVKAKAFECATIPALMISTHHYFTKHMAECIAHQKQPLFTNISVYQTIPRPGGPPRIIQSHTADPLTSDNDYHIEFAMAASLGHLGHLKGVSVYIKWRREGEDDLLFADSGRVPHATPARRNSRGQGDHWDMLNSGRRYPFSNLPTDTSRRSV